MSSYYTSYQTSLALRQAGAPQEIPAGGGYWRDFGDVQHRYVTSVDREAVEDVIRSMRLDEILEALEKTAGSKPALMPVHGKWQAIVAVAEGRDERIGHWWDDVEGNEDTPVEAAAACWLAVLRAGSEVAR